VVKIDLDDVVGYGFVYYVVSIDLDDVVGYGFATNNDVTIRLL
jgi:hypothetical protein